MFSPEVAKKNMGQRYSILVFIDNYIIVVHGNLTGKNFVAIRSVRLMMI